MPTALVTGASRGLGRALAAALAADGWRVVVDGRDGDALRSAAPAGTTVVPGDVTEPQHRQALRTAVGDTLDLLINNASDLGPSPLPPLAALELAALRQVIETNVVAPLALVQELLPALSRANSPTVVMVSSDAAVEAYEGWGGYGASKAALDQVAAVLAVEQPDLRVLAIDPGDMRTAMHQAAFPGEDISDRPLPEDVVPAFLALLTRPSGRYRVADVDAARLAGTGVPS